jgi:hypothetical protein
VAGHGGYATGGILVRQQSVCIAMRDVTDGLSNTLMAGEISWNTANCYRIWLRGSDATAMGSAKNVNTGINLTPYNGSNNFNDVSFGSMHAGGAHFVLGDGTVRFISQNIDFALYQGLASRAGSELVSDF